jgi:uncharacterized membrane protein YfcA
MIGSLAMPLVAAVSDIPTAISVLLPTYVVMDLIVAWIYRKQVPFALLWPMALAGVGGVAIAALIFRLVDTTCLAFLLGFISMVLGVRFFATRGNQANLTPMPHAILRRWPRTAVLNGASGFTSFFLMGEAPVQVYLLPFRLAPQTYVAVLVWFFFIVNWVKIPIVLGMGIVTSDSLWISAMLLPIMPVGILIGKFIATRIPKEPFYVVIHILLIVLGAYLLSTPLRGV